MSIPDTYRIPFGKYQGKTIGAVPAQYLDWLSGQDWVKKWPEVLLYIKENRAHLDAELDQEEEDWYA